MARIILKKSSVVGKVPTADELVFGEVAINFADGRLYYKNSDNQVKSFLDSNLVEALIDSDHVRPLARAAIVAGTNITYDSATGVISSTASGGGGGLDSAAVNILIDAADTHDSSAVQGQIDSSTFSTAVITSGTFDSARIPIVGIIVEDEGTALTTAATRLNFTGTGVTASGTGTEKTINITGGGGGTPDYNDNDFLNLGTGDDMSLYHNGTNSFIDNDTGHLLIRNNVAADVGGNIYLQAKSGENGIIINDDGEVQLYYDNAEKLNTSNTGVTVTGTLTATNLSGDGSSVTNVDAQTVDGINSTSFLRHDANIANNFTLTDGTKIEFGTGLDAEIYHDGTNTYIDNDTGHLLIRNNVAGDVGGNIYLQAKSGENGIIINDDGEVQLYYDNSEKLNTSNTGVTVTGTLTATSLSGDGASITNVDAQTVDGINSTSFLRHDANIANNFTLTDGTKIEFGTGLDAEIYHDGTNTYFDNDTGHLLIRGNVAGDVGGNIYLQAKAGENGIIINDDGEVQLYYDGSEKLNTSNTGVTVTGTLSATNLSGDGSSVTNVDAATVDGINSTSFLRHDANIANNFTLTDGTKIEFGTGLDAEIYHDGTNTYFDNDTGHILIRGNVAGDVGGDIYLQAKAGENGIVIQDDAEVQLYYNGSEKLNTTNTGVTITGALTAGGLVYPTTDGSNGQVLTTNGSGTLSFTTVSGGGGGTPDYDDNDLLNLGTGDDMSLYHTGTHSFIDNDTGNLYIRNNVAGDVGGDIYIMPHDNENGIIIQEDGEVQLYYNNVEKLNTSNTGVTVTGTLTATSLSGNGSSLTNVDAETLDGINSTSFLRHDANIANDFTLTDNTVMEMGTGADGKLYHTGLHQFFDNNTGNLYIRNNVNGDVNGDIYIMPHDNENGIIIQDDGEVQLYYNNVEKLNTTNTGVTVTGTLIATTFSGNGSSLTNVDAETLDGINSTSFLRHDANIANDITFTDNTVIELGTGADAKLYHTGLHQFFDNNTGNLYIRNNVNADVNGDIYIMPHDNENGIIIQDDGEVQLYYNGSEKLNTSNTGVTVTGTLTATSFSGNGASITNVDAATVDGINSTSFLRHDANIANNFTLTDNTVMEMGTGADGKLYHTGVHQ